MTDDVAPKTVEERLEHLTARLEHGDPADQLLLALLQLLASQVAALRNLEGTVAALQDRLQFIEGRGSGRIPAAPLSRTVRQTRRSTDLCSFCGQNATGTAVIFSTPAGVGVCGECIDTFNAMRS